MIQKGQVSYIREAHGGQDTLEKSDTKQLHENLAITTLRLINKSRFSLLPNTVAPQSRLFETQF